MEELEWIGVRWKIGGRCHERMKSFLNGRGGIDEVRGRMRKLKVGADSSASHVDCFSACEWSTGE